MGCVKIIVLSSVFLLALVKAQEYAFEEYDFEPNVRERRDVGDFILQRSYENLNEHQRFRRDDENARLRRHGGNGGHGGGNGGGHEGITGPVHTFVKTDEHANFKWGVRHHVGHEYAGHH